MQNKKAQVLGNQEKGLLFVVSAPAGTGKTTLVQMLVKEFPHCIAQSVSCTTRKPRVGERDGQHYRFLSKEQFEEKSREGEFLEEATVFGNRYGTLKKNVDHVQKLGKHVILVIDTQGAKQLKESLSAVFIFIAPPSLAVLKDRLAGRKTEKGAGLEMRMKRAEKELSEVACYDYCLVNDDLNVTYNQLKSIIIAEENRIRIGEKNGSKKTNINE